jgi:hypothetical protein
MRLSAILSPVLFALAAVLYAQTAEPVGASKAVAARPTASIGFDRNEYPGDGALRTLRQHFAFAGYWLNNPPGVSVNPWRGKRQILLDDGFGFLVLFNGRLDTQIAKAGTPSALGTKDAVDAIAAARRENFPDGTILFLDQEEGGRLTSNQAGYLFAWTEAIGRSIFRAGAYVSGQPVGDGPGRTITTAQDIQQHVTTQHLRPVALWVYQDACPPAHGCTLQAPPLSGSGTPDAVVWQYAQSPRRKAITAACAKTYAADGNCYVSGLPGVILDLNVATSADPSHGR